MEEPQTVPIPTDNENMPAAVQLNEGPAPTVQGPAEQQECVGHAEVQMEKKIDDGIEPAEEEDDDDDYDEDEDDDEEKENSQKLVIDIDDDDEEEEEVEEDEDEDEKMPNEIEGIVVKQNPEQISEGKDLIKTNVEEEKPPVSITLDEADDAIITLSDGEEEISALDANAKPGKIQKRKSMGATPAGANEDEQRFRLKRRKINVEGAPKMPLTGYVRYMNDRRESARKEFPNKTNIEITKQIGEEWQSLPGDIKSEYLEAAEKDKKRYTSELHTFLKSRPDILASELAKNKIRKTDNNVVPSNNIATKPANLKEKPPAIEQTKLPKEIVKDKPVLKEPSNITEKQPTQDKPPPQPKRKPTPTPPSTSASSSLSTGAAGGTSTAATVFAVSTNIITPTPGEIPIFTNEFLEHNKLYDMELRSLRKSKTDLEQQNFVLEKHVENMKCGVEKMVAENNEIQEKNRLLEIYLDKLKRKLAHALSTLPLPNAPNGATMENIDKYMQDLYKMSTSNSHGPATLNKAKDIIRKLDLQIQL